jgi:single-strand DNA-binding protein
MINKAILVGNLGKDPEIRYTPNGIPVATFSIATNKKWTDKASGDKKNKTSWHRIIVWRKRGEICAEYLKKGSLVYIEGEIQTRTWEKDKITHYITEIIASDVRFLNRPPGNNTPPVNMEVPPELGDDDIPF